MQRTGRIRCLLLFICHLLALAQQHWVYPCLGTKVTCFRPQARPLAHNSEVHLPALIWKTSRPRALLTASPGTAAPADLQSPCPSCASPCCSAEALLKTLFKEGSCCIWLHGQVKNIRSYSSRASLLQCLAKPCNCFHSAVYLMAD